MEGVILRLLPKVRRYPPLDLPLHLKNSYTSVSDLVCDSESAVFSDWEYSLILSGLSLPDVSDVRVWLNDELLKCSIVLDESRQFVLVNLIKKNDSPEEIKVFSESFGFVRFLVEISYSDGIHLLESNYIQVMVRKAPKYDSVRRMADYVYRHNTGLLYGREALPQYDVDNNDTRKTIEAKLLLLRKISLVYEENFQYFKANSRFTTIPEAKVDDFSKLQYVTNGTLQYIARHPEYLVRASGNSGIQVGRNYYQPTKTLVMSNDRSFDIYENRVLVSFLVRLCQDISVLEQEISQLIDKVPTLPLERDGYISSSSYIYEGTVETLRQFQKEISGFRFKFQSLLLSYRKILAVKEQPLNTVPRFSPIFRGVPQYHQVFDCIVAWFSNSEFSLQQEKYILTVMKITELYELYVLAKILNFYRDNGFKLQDATRVIYPFASQTFYENTDCNNKYEFLKGEQKITVYFQPVIYHEDRRDLNGLGLYRNTSIGYSISENEPGRSGKYYTPDYVIKYENVNGNGIDYMICDAKYSHVDKIKSTLFSELAYKYLFSISPFDMNDRVVELCVFSGISYVSADGVTDVFDYCKYPRQGIPQAEIVTLTENSLNNAALHNLLLRGTIGRVRPDRTLTTDILPQPQYRAQAPIQNDTNAVRQSGAQSSRGSVADNITHSVGTRVTDDKSAVVLAQKDENKPVKPAPQDFLLEKLDLPESLLEYLESLGMKTIGDVVPNSEHSDLLKLDKTNRQMRRKLEGVFKEKGVILK